MYVMQRQELEYAAAARGMVPCTATAPAKLTRLLEHGFQAFGERACVAACSNPGRFMHCSPVQFLLCMWMQISAHTAHTGLLLNENAPTALEHH